MNHLNSVIVEGKVTGPVELVESTGGSKSFQFTIRSVRYEGDEMIEIASYIDIVTYGKLADHSSVECVEGRGIRVVGRIKQVFGQEGVEDGRSYVFIVADHIEYKPMFRKGGK